MYSLRLLGGVVLQGPSGLMEGRVVQPRPLAFLCLLAASWKQGCSRSKAIGILWGDTDERRARHQLSDTLYVLRHALGQDAVLASGEVLRLNLEAVQTDVAAFEQALDDGSLEEGAHLYGGEFLEGFHLGGAPVFERWAESARQRLALHYSETVETLARQAEDAKDFRGAVQWWRRLVAHDQYNSRVKLRLLRALQLSGDPASALQQAEEHRRLLTEDLGVEPDAEFLAYVERLKREPVSIPLPPELASTPSSVQVVPTDTRHAPDAATAELYRVETVQRGLRHKSVVRWVVGVAGVATVAATVTIGLMLLLPRPDPELDPDTIVVAPFEAFGPELQMWGEGVVDMLFHRLDGAGPLSGVSPSVAMRLWEGQDDPASIRRFARRAGAGLTLWGHFLQVGADSVHVIARLEDVAAQRTLEEFELMEHSGSVHHIADSLAVLVMARLSRERSLGAVPLRSLGSSDVQAVRAFLRAEQYYRRFRLDSALQHYRLALQADSSFALVYDRLAQMALSSGITEELPAGALGSYGSGQWAAWSLEAGNRNRGLARRESLLVVADSLEAAAWRITHGAPVRSPVPHGAADALLQRFQSTLQLAGQLYPRDAEIWYRRAAAHFWHPLALGGLPEECRAAFSRAVELDSSFVPAYHELIRLDLHLGGAEAGRRTIVAYLRHAAETRRADAYRLVAELLDPSVHVRARGERRLDSLLAERGSLSDTDLELTVAAELLKLAASPWALHIRWAGGVGPHLPSYLRVFGRFREAHVMNGYPGDWPDDGLARLTVFADLARSGVIPSDSVAAVYEEWLSGPPLEPSPDTASAVRLRASDNRVASALRWWAQQGDAGSLSRAMARWEGVRDAADLPHREIRWVDYRATTAQGYLALVRGDSASALQAFTEYRQCDPYCRDAAVTRAEILAASGRYEEADSLFAWIAIFGYPSDVVYALLLRGRINEQLGNREKAIWAYWKFLDYWRNGDPEVQPYVEEARAALGRLGQVRWSVS
jgi:DNA-binding SARP family transcriptional activator